jgi:hypothetical protein
VKLERRTFFVVAVAAVVAWVLLITSTYVRVVIFENLNAPNVGKEREWALAWIAGVILFALFRLASVHVVTLGYAALAAIACTFVILSGQVLTALAAVLLIAGSFGTGHFLFRAGRGDVDDELLVPTVAGLGVWSVIAFGATGVGLASPWFFWVSTAIAAGAGGSALYRSSFKAVAALRRSLHRSYSVDVLNVAAAAFVLLNFTWALAPEVSYDALNYHLAVPKAHLAAGRLVELPNFYQSYFYGAAESLFAAAMAMAGSGAAKLLNFSFVLLSAVAVSGIARTFLSSPAPQWAAVLYLTTPLIGWQSTTADVEPALTLFLLTSFLLLVRSRGGFTRATLVTSGFLAGIAIGVKLVAVLFLAGPGLWVAWRQRTSRGDLARAAAYLGIILISAAPWYGLRYAYSGNPLHPFYGPLFGRPAAPPHIENVFEPFRVKGSVREVVSLPWRFTYGTRRFSESGVPSGGAGLALLLAVPAAISLVRRQGEPRLVVLTMAVHLLLWAYLFTYARYFAPVLPLLCVTGAASLMMYFRGRASAVALGLVVVTVAAQGALMPVHYWVLSDRYPIRHALGKETAEQLLRRVHPLFAGAAYLNQATVGEEKVLTRGLERLRFYIRPQLSSWLMTLPFHRAMAGATDHEIHEFLWAEGFRYFAADASSPPYGAPFDREEFRHRRMEIVFRDGPAEVYRLAPPVQGQRPAP